MRRSLQVFVGTLACFVLVSPGVCAQKKQAKKLSVRVTYLASTVRVGSSEEGEPSRTTTAWYTPNGDRRELADGNVHIWLKPGERFYWIETEKKLVLRSNPKLLKPASKAFTGTEAKELERTFGGMMQGVKTESGPTSHFLGRTCRVSKQVIKLPALSAKIETWTADVAGHQVVFRSAYYGYEGGRLATVSLEEAVDVAVVEKTPAGLLDVPSGYTVHDITADQMRGILKALTEAMKKPTNRGK
jgi:hypothetical protein